MTSQGGRFVQTSAPPGVINLGLGQPSPRLLPLAEIGRAAQAQLGSGGDPLVLQYGALLGDPEFRSSLARWLSDEYQHPVAAEQLMVTAGTSSALSFVSQIFAAPGATVVSEDPTYFLANGVFQSAGLHVRGVPIDERGLDLDALERLLASGVRPAFVYVIPAFQNPTGACLQPERARELVDVAERHDFLIIADEPYVALHYGDVRPGTMMAHDRGRARVLSLGSFSKLLGPGLRLGWAHGEPKLIERLSMHGTLRSGGCFNPVIANIVQHTIDSGFLTAHVEQLRDVFGARASALTAALHEHIPSARFTPPRGGYFCWVELDDDVDSEALLERASDLRFIPGRRCAVERELARFVRLSFSFYEDHELVEGVRRLARALADQ
jgi:DNA-binding transcriptional MocR family regulator